MPWIELHYDCKILKLGIRWALYGEPRPILEYSYSKGASQHQIDALTKWREQSRIVYLKEREFKKGSIVYYKDKPIHSWYTKLKLGKRYNKLSWRFNALDGSKGFGIIEETKITHYCPGQQVESFKYVREVKTSERQEPHQMKTKFGDYESKITVETFEWQEVEEPAEYLTTEKNGIEWKTAVTDPDHTQFQKGVDEGIILAITKQ